MYDMNFNPGIGWTKPFYSKGRYIGKVSLIVEHESNGRDSIQSRSWNRISLAGSALLTRNLLVHAKYWIPIIDSGNNLDILNSSSHPHSSSAQDGISNGTPSSTSPGGCIRRPISISSPNITTATERT